MGSSSTFPLRFFAQLVIAVALIGFVVGYATWQARFLLAGPQLAMATTPPPTQTERTTTIAGQATNIVSLSLNGREIFTDREGNFEETIILENGYTIVTLAARDRYDRVRTAEYGVVYLPAVTD